MNLIRCRATLLLCAATAWLSAPLASRAQEAASAVATTLARPARIFVDRACAPGMPMAALKEGAHGTTQLRFDVDATGRVTAVEIVQGAGRDLAHRSLDSAAARDLSKCKFEPGLDAAGQPVASQTTVNDTWKFE